MNVLILFFGDLLQCGKLFEATNTSSPLEYEFCTSTTSSPSVFNCLLIKYVCVTSRLGALILIVSFSGVPVMLPCMTLSLISIISTVSPLYRAWLFFSKTL